MTHPPANLNPSGLKHWEKYKENAMFLRKHFLSDTDWLDYKDEKELSWIRTRLLEDVEDPGPIDPRLLRNLCRILNRLETDIDELDRRFR